MKRCQFMDGTKGCRRKAAYRVFSRDGYEVGYVCQRHRNGILKTTCTVKPLKKL